MAPDKETVDDNVEVLSLGRSQSNPDGGSTVDIMTTLKNTADRATTETLKLRNWAGEVVASKTIDWDAYAAHRTVEFNVNVPSTLSDQSYYLGRESTEVNVGDVVHSGVDWRAVAPAWWTSDPDDEMPEAPGAKRGYTEDGVTYINWEHPADMTPDEPDETDGDSGGSASGGGSTTPTDPDPPTTTDPDPPTTTDPTSPTPPADQTGGSSDGSGIPTGVDDLDGDTLRRALPALAAIGGVVALLGGGSS